MNKPDLALNNQQWLIYRKNQTKPIKRTKSLFAISAVNSSRTTIFSSID